MALYAVARGRDVGVDVEHRRRELADPWVARFFSPADVAALRAVSAARWPAAFFERWVSMEARAKAQGHGLAAAVEARAWSFQTVDAGPDVAAAVAAEGQAWRLACWEWVWPVSSALHRLPA